MLTPFFLCCLTYSLLAMNNALANPNILKFPLIHQHSPQSPFFQRNLSTEERIKRSITQSDVRANYLTSSPSLAPRIKLTTQNYVYIVQICLGTFRSEPPCKKYYLGMDTGSSLTWLQCEGCKVCYHQVPPLYPAKKSKSYQRGHFSSKSYQAKYKDGSFSKGDLARETFYFPSNNGSTLLTKIENLKFGCGLNNDLMDGKLPDNYIAGIFGLGGNNVSILNQLGPLANGVFSYCLPLNNKNSYLTFGDAQIKPGIAKSTKLYTRRDIYFVELMGISIDGTRLKINPSVFGFESSNGLIVDSGTPYSRLVSPAFDILKQGLEKRFSSNNFKRVHDETLELCYEIGNLESLNNLPSLTFHFRGSNADFVTKGESVFIKLSRSTFCLAMMRHPTLSIFGSGQQINHMISYDTKKGLLIFYPEDCSLG